MSVSPAFHRVRKRFRKFGAMDRAEVLDRVRQAASQRVDTALARFGYRFTPAFGPGVEIPAHRFFFHEDSVSQMLALVRDRLPGRTEEIVAQARRCCTHRFDLLGYRGVDYGKTIDWHADKVHAKCAPRLPFHRVPYFDYARVGDPKIIWELNRHQHFVTLAKAYRITGDPVFSEELLAQWQSWHAANPYPIGINWVSSLEVAFRALSWLWTFFILERSAAMTPSLRSSMLHALALAARHIERYLSTYSSPNTHLLGEAVALFFIGMLCPSIPHARRRQEAGWNTILSEAQRQVNADGMHFEHSTHYHVYALDFLLHAMILAEGNGIAVPHSLRATVRNMLDALCRLATNGMPRLGDDDGGRVFDGRRNRAEHLADPLATGAILFERGDFKSVCGDLHEEVIWLLGAAGIDVWDRLAAVPPTDGSSALSDSGVYFIGARVESLRAVVDAGTPAPSAPGHWHAGCLSLTLSANGKPLAIDPGTYVYADARERVAFRGTGAHSTMQVDGRNQAEPDGPFAWTGLPNVRVERWVAAEHFDLLCASHDGYGRLARGLIHRRFVVSVHSRFLFVRDVVYGQGDAQLDQYWHLAPELACVAGDALLFSSSDGDALALVAAREDVWTPRVYTASWSPVYGRAQPAAVVRFGARASLPADFAVVAAALHGQTARAGTLARADAHPNNGVAAYRYQTDSDEYLFCFAGAATPWAIGACASDAEFLCVQRTRGALTLLALCNGTYARIDGRTVVCADRPIPIYEVKW